MRFFSTEPEMTSVIQCPSAGPENLESEKVEPDFEPTNEQLENEEDDEEEFDSRLTIDV